MTCLRGCIITQVAFVWLFSTVRFQMCLQMAWLRWCIITQVAFVRFFSIVRFQMCLQIACVRGGIITQVALFPPLYIDNPFAEILLHRILIFKILYHRQGKACPLLRLVWNWENSLVKMLSKKKESEIGIYKIGIYKCKRGRQPKFPNDSP